MARRKEPVIPDAVLDQLLAGADPKMAFDPNGLFTFSAAAYNPVPLSRLIQVAA